MRFPLSSRASRVAVGSFAAIGLLAVGLTSVRAADDAAAKPKYSISEVMKKGFKGNTALVKKITAGTATAEDKKLFVEYCTALAANKPEKGDEADWKTRTAALLKASQDIEKGEKDLAAVKKATTCKACHDLHRKEE